MFTNADEPSSLLREAFGDPPVLVADVPDWVLFGRNEPVRPLPPEPLSSFDREIDDLGQTPDFQADMERYGTHSTDSLAVYLPYSFHGPARWGIYYNDDAIFNFVIRMAQHAVGQHPDMKLSLLQSLVYKAIRMHELFHFAVEMAAAQLTIIQGGTDCYRLSFSDPDVSSLEEGLATLFEMQQPRAWKARPASGLDRESLDAFRSAWEAASRPSPYSNWIALARDPRNAMDDLTERMSSLRAAPLLHAHTQLIPHRPRKSVLPEHHRLGQRSGQIGGRGAAQVHAATRPPDGGNR